MAELMTPAAKKASPGKPWQQEALTKVYGKVSAPGNRKPLRMDKLAADATAPAAVLEPMPSSRRVAYNTALQAAKKAKPTGLAVQNVVTMPSLVDEEEGRTDRMLLERSKAQTAIVKQRRRSTRLFVWCSLIFLAWGCWNLFNIGSTMIEVRS